MIVCSCNVLSDGQIRDAVARAEAAPRTPGQVYRCLGCSAQCGRCARTIKSILDAATGACSAAGAGCAGCPAHHEITHLEEALEAALQEDLHETALVA